MRLYTYVIPFDTGFAPHPFGGYCTLATCKPDIRRCARPHWDQQEIWVAGKVPANNGRNDRLVYAMRVDEILTWAEYGGGPRFLFRQPQHNTNGDSIYFQDSNGCWWRRANPSHMSLANFETDVTKGRNVLVSGHFYYFGRAAVQIPAAFRDMFRVRRKHKVSQDTSVAQFVAWLQSTYSPGVHATPTRWTAAPAPITFKP